MNLPRFLPAALGLILLGLVAACATRTSRRPPSVEIVATAGANHNLVTAIDLVLVYDRSAIPLLPGTNAAWFAARPQFRAELAHAVDVVPLLLPPSTDERVNWPRRATKAVAILAYTGHTSAAGWAPFKLPANQDLRLRLGPDQVELQHR